MKAEKTMVLKAQSHFHQAMPGTCAHSTVLSVTQKANSSSRKTVSPIGAGLRRSMSSHPPMAAMPITIATGSPASRP